MLDRLFRWLSGNLAMFLVILKTYCPFWVIIDAIWVVVSVSKNCYCYCLGLLIETFHVSESRETRKTKGPFILHAFFEVKLRSKMSRCASEVDLNF